MEGDEMDESMRAFFPLSFGKTSRSQPNTSLAHSSTRRSTPAPASSSAYSVKPNSKPNIEEDEDGVIVGPPPPPPASRVEDGGGEEESMIGPPRPPPAISVDDEEGQDVTVIGPPRPPPQSNQKQSLSGQDGSGDETDEEFDEYIPEDTYQIPLSNEIVLRGHTKVLI
jgi:WD repeat-containing protein 70